MYFLWYLLIGLVAGWIANLIVKGNGSGLIVNLIVGLIGGLLGGWIVNLNQYNHVIQQYYSFTALSNEINQARCWHPSSAQWCCCGSSPFSHGIA
mgnify:CR=1 FL=1